MTKCEHKWLEPMREGNTSIWCCQCGLTKPRKYVAIYSNEKDDTDLIYEVDDIRVINILSNQMRISRPQALELLKQATFDNPLKLNGEMFWVEEQP